MRRTTISLPDNVAAALNREARRRGMPVSRVAREAIEAHLGIAPGERRKLPFVALGRSAYRTTARDIDKILEEEWAPIAIVDAGPLYASVDENDEEHERCRDVLQRSHLELAALVGRYSDFPLGGTDASVAILAG